jgi:hypothetical protein
VRRWLLTVLVLLSAALAAPAVALAHDAPESDSSRWVMADWMMNTFFLFSGLALVGFLAAWKGGYLHDLESDASIPLYIDEEDYYTPDWAYDEEEWADEHAER